MSINEILTFLGVFVGGIILTLAGYSKKPKEVEHQDALVTGVGIELGNRLQTDQVIHELKRIADSLAVLADLREAARDAKLNRFEDILERLAAEERRS